MMVSNKVHGMLYIPVSLKSKSPWINRQLNSCVICVSALNLLFYHLQIRDDEVKCWWRVLVGRPPRTELLMIIRIIFSGFVWRFYFTCRSNML